MYGSNSIEISSSQEKRAKRALIKAIEDNLTSPGLVRHEAVKAVRTSPFLAGGKLAWLEFVDIAEIINYYLNSEAEKSNSKFKKILPEAIIQGGKQKKDFLFEVRIKDVVLTKVKVKMKEEYYESFISDSSISKAWGESEGKNIKAGPRTWDVLVLFMNIFKSFGELEFGNYAAWETYINKKGNNLIFNPNQERAYLIEEIEEKMFQHPIWRISPVQIYNFLNTIYTSYKLANKKTPLCLTVTGTHGVSKTHFVYQIIQRYLAALEITKIDRISLIKSGLSGVEVNDKLRKQKIIELVNTARDGILVFDSYYEENKDVEFIIDVIKKMLNTDGYENTCIILLGHHINIMNLINKYDLSAFQEKNNIRFFPPRMNILTEIFNNYLLCQTNLVLNDEAKTSVRYYFRILYAVKKIKLELALKKIIASDRVYRYEYSSECNKLYKSIMSGVKKGEGWLTQEHVINSNIYQSIQSEYNDIWIKYPQELQWILPKLK